MIYIASAIVVVYAVRVCCILLYKFTSVLRNLVIRNGLARYSGIIFVR